MAETKSTEQIRIKDIAAQAGVSVGTVDRVLHGRPNVSKKARAKVEAVLNEIDYKPNRYASALASNRKYHFHCLLPQHEDGSYWTEVVKGLHEGRESVRDFHVSMTVSVYDQFDSASFRAAAQEMMAAEPDGVVMVPQEHAVTREVCKELRQKGIPFIFLDSNFVDLNALSFFGQNPWQSGKFAARIFMLQAAGSTEVLLIRLISGGRVASKQQEYREEGFRQYMREFHPDCRIRELNLQVNAEGEQEAQLDAFFAAHPEVRHGITFSSRVFVVGEYLLRRNHRDIHLMGYDVLPRNLECLKKGVVDFLIAQHPCRQGFESIKALFDHLVLKTEILRDNYMPIELLSTENYMYYSTR